MRQHHSMIPLLIILACLLIQQGYEWISLVPCSSFLPGCGNLLRCILRKSAQSGRTSHNTSRDIFSGWFPFLIQHLLPAFAIHCSHRRFSPPSLSPLASGSCPDTALPPCGEHSHALAPAWNTRGILTPDFHLSNLAD